MNLDLRRRFYAEELEAVARLRSPALVDALASVPRERFLRPGPWTVLADSGDSFMTGFGIRTRTTPDADPARVYHNIAVAIDPGRQLFNGQPGTLCVWIDALNLAPGARVLHIGSGLGYYTAVIAACVGPAGRVVAFEVDDALAREAQANLAAMAWVEARHGNGANVAGPFDAILVNAGVTHPLETWLDALAPAGRMLVPVTATMPAMGSTIGKGVVMLVTHESRGEWSAGAQTVVAIYSAVGVRDEKMNERIGNALRSGPARWMGVRRLRRDAHEPVESCWLHGPTCCFSSASSESAVLVPPS